MPAKKKAVRRPRAATPARTAKSRLQKTWKETQAALSSAEATVEKRVKELVKKSGVDTRQAADALKTWSHRLERERKKALKQVEGRLAVFQTRAKKERRALGRTVDEAVQRTLAALNIPSRQEVQELTRRVEELSHRIDKFRR
jgi:polyhydroxyalkanoate synthesis regulator phasin